MTSGAIQNGVPTKVFFLVIVADSWPETPKSANFTWPLALNKIFAAWRSLVLLVSIPALQKNDIRHTFDVTVQFMIIMQVVQSM